MEPRDFIDIQKVFCFYPFCFSFFCRRCSITTSNFWPKFGQNPLKLRPSNKIITWHLGSYMYASDPVTIVHLIPSEFLQHKAGANLGEKQDNSKSGVSGP